MSLRLAFMGTPDFAVPTLRAILAAGHEVAAVYTRAPKPAGRGMRPRATPVGQEAERHGVPVRTPRTLRDEAEQAALAALGLDGAVVVAYGLILPKAVLDAPRLGCLNLHASLLPRWRGAAPIHRAVLAGDPETGIGVMRMEEGLDTGPVALERRLPVGPDDTTGDLHDRLAEAGAALMVEALAGLEAGTLRFSPQAEAGVTYAQKITNEEARLSFDRPAGEVHDQIRGLSPFPGAFFEADLGRGPERVKVLRSAVADGRGEPGTWLAGGLVACREGAIRPLVLQRQGRSAVPADEFLRGIRIEPGARLL